MDQIIVRDNKGLPKNVVASDFIGSSCLLSIRKWSNEDRITTERWSLLASHAGQVLLQLPQTVWDVFQPPLGESTISLVGRTWIGPYRHFEDRDALLAQRAEFAAMCGGKSDDHFHVPEMSGFVLRRLHAQPETLWTLGLYNFGWKNLPGQILRLERSVWKDNIKFMFRRLESELHRMPNFSAYLTTPTIEWFHSAAGDPFLASVWLVDWLVGQLTAASNTLFAERETAGTSVLAAIVHQVDMTTATKVSLLSHIIEAKLPPAARAAWLSYQRAMEKCPNLANERDDGVHEWLAGHDPDSETYELPNREAWKRYLRIARAALGQSKHTLRAGRTGRSVIRPDESG